MTDISKVKNPALVSRFDELALATSILINKTIHAGETIERGTLMVKEVSGGKYRSYFEATVKAGGDFSAASTAFSIDPTTSPLAANLRVGDVIESVGGAALGTVATYNPVTGAGTLAANSTSALAAGNQIRIATSQCALASNAGKILQDEAEVTADNDKVATGYFSGFFLQAFTTVTDAALTALGGVTIDTGEIRLK